MLMPASTSKDEKAYRKSSIKPPSLISPPLPFRGGKLISPPPSPSPNRYSSQLKLTINMYLSVMVYSGWKFILFLVFGRMTSNFICLTFSTLRSSSLWRIVTIFLSLDKAVYRPGTTSPSSRNLAPVAKLNKPPSKVLEKNKPPGGLNRGFTVSKAKSQRKYDTLFFYIWECCFSYPSWLFLFFCRF